MDFETFRRRVYKVVEPMANDATISKLYDFGMMFVILISLYPLVTHSTSKVVFLLDIIPCCIFIIDYLLRWLTADYSSGKKGIKAFLLYPVTPAAIIDLLSILPSLTIMSSVFKLFRVPRLFKIFRVFKFARYYEDLNILSAVIKREGRTLLAVLVFAVVYILVCAMVMFNVENDPSFSTFFDAFYWACCTLTTVGYGDIIPVSAAGRAVSMMSSIVGIALVALPSGIITSGYMEELRSRNKNKHHDEKKG